MASKQRLFVVGAAILALSLLLSLPAAYAAVDLVYFRAKALADNTVEVSWGTATERDVTGFRLYRSESAAPADWGSPITDPFPAQGNAVTGADYQYVDAAVTVGVKYYYLLREVNGSGTTDHGPISQGVGIATDTPTATASTAVGATATATWTRPVTGGITGTPTKIPPPPTATPRFTLAPTSLPTATATRPGAPTAVPQRTAAPTPLPGASVATPTGQAPRVTIPPPVQPTMAATPVSPLPSPTPSPTFAVVTAPANTVIETATVRPTREVTPVIFAAETTEGRSGTPQAPEQVAGQGSRSTSLALVIGGSAIGLAALLIAVLLFLRSRRS